MLSARILLVEDDATNSFFLVELLTLMGLPQPDIARNGEEAIARAEQAWPDLVFMDCQMPIMDGFEATRRLRLLETGQTRRLPIIALTAFAFEEDRQACFLAGMDDFLTKPVQEESLQRVLRERLGIEVASIATPRVANTLLDQDGFEALCDMLGRDGTQVLIQTFLDGLPEKLTGIRQAGQTQAWADLVRYAHTLKGNASMLKAPAMSTLCLEMMRLAKTDDPGQALVLLPELEDMARQLTQSLEQVLARLAT